MLEINSIPYYYYDICGRLLISLKVCHMSKCCSVLSNIPYVRPVFMNLMACSFSLFPCRQQPPEPNECSGRTCLTFLVQEIVQDLAFLFLGFVIFPAWYAEQEINKKYRTKIIFYTLQLGCIC